jgi:diaminopimelate decarboxylase
MIAQQLSHVYPIGSRIDERGRLEIGGCDAIELAREFGTPAYVYAEDDLRARARAFREAAGEAMRVVYASKACPAVPVLEVFAQEGLSCDVASGGELHLALRAGFPADRLVLHGNARSEAELAMAVEAGVGLIVLDNADDIDKLERLGRPQRVLLRVTPDVRGDTHDHISTGQADSKFGFNPADAHAAVQRLAGHDTLELAGLHAHIGSQLFDLAPFEAAVGALAEIGADWPVYDIGGGLGIAYAAEQQPPPIEDYVGAIRDAASARLAGAQEILIEPGRSLVANAGVTLYTVESLKRNVSLWVGVDGGMSDNLRPMLYGARYEAQVADRFGGDTLCHVAGKHCESSDVIVRDALLDDPRPGDVIVTPATGAYGYAMASNYNGVPRPPVIFCRGGDARAVVRRETFEDLER